MDLLAALTSDSDPKTIMTATIKSFMTILTRTSNMNNDLKVIHWNCNGITNKINELQAFIHKIRADIMLLRETKLNSNSFLKIPNYHTSRFDNIPRPRKPAFDGTAVLIHRTLGHQQINLITSLASTTIETSFNNH